MPRPTFSPTALQCSVIVPVYNGAGTIRHCLEALAQQSIPLDQYEIIVVDDGSQDQTAKVVRGWQAEHPQVPLELLQQPNAGPGAARNLGAQAAHGPLLLFTDADCAPAPNWIASLLTVLQEPGVVGAKGVYRSRQRAWVARFVQAEYEDRYDRMRSLTQIDSVDTYSAGYQRAVFLANGGFDPQFRAAACEDQEFSFRLAAQGYRMVFVPAAWVEHRHVETVYSYARRKYHVGYWRFLLSRWHPERLLNDSHTPQTLKVQIALVALLIGLLFATLLGRRWRFTRWTQPAMGLCGLAFFITAMPFLRKLAHASPRLAWVGSVMLVIRALALGVGFFVGLLHYFLASPPGLLAKDCARESSKSV